jgi:hypothetical protein
MAKRGRKPGSVPWNKGLKGTHVASDETPVKRARIINAQKEGV